MNVLMIGDPSCGKSQLLRFCMNLFDLRCRQSARQPHRTSRESKRRRSNESNTPKCQQPSLLGRTRRDAARGSARTGAPGHPASPRGFAAPCRSGTRPASRGHGSRTCRPSSSPSGCRWRRRPLASVRELAGATLLIFSFEGCRNGEMHHVAGHYHILGVRLILPYCYYYLLLW